METNNLMQIQYAKQDVQIHFKNCCSMNPVRTLNLSIRKVN